MRIAALDLGSNTFLMLIAEMNGKTIEKILLDETCVTRLGQGVHSTKEFHQDALMRAEMCFSDFSELIKLHRVEKVVAVATSAARDVKNRKSFVDLGMRYGIPIQIIPGYAEAEMTFLGASYGLPIDAKTTVVDVGGGSTEIIGSKSKDQLKGKSIDIGSVRLTEMFLSEHPCPPNQIVAMEEYIRERIFEARRDLPKPGRPIVAVAGTPTTLAALEREAPFDEAKIHGFRLRLERIWQWRDKLAAMSVPQRQALPGMQVNRADVLVAGVTILALICESLDSTEVIVSTKGVRFGLVQQWQKY